MYFKDEVLTFIEEENVQFIKLLFFDVFGRQKNVSILPSRMSRTFEKGVTIDATAVTGFNNPDHQPICRIASVCRSVRQEICHGGFCQDAQ